MQNKEIEEEYHLLPQIDAKKTLYQLYQENTLKLWVEHTISEAP